MLSNKEAIERAQAETAQENYSNTLIDSVNLSGEALERIDAIFILQKSKKGV